MIKFIVKTYRLDISKEADFRIYSGIVEDNKDRGFVKDTMLAVQRKSDFDFKVQGEHILDENYLFDNQFNTVGKDGENGLRLWFWSENIYDNKNIRDGYYVAEGAEQIREAIDNRCSCDYCGKQYSKDMLGKQCTACMGSEYMEEDNYCLTQITPLKWNSYDKNYKPSDEWIKNHLKLQTITKLEKEINHKKRMKESYAKDMISINEKIAGYEKEIIELNLQLNNIK